MKNLREWIEWAKERNIAIGHFNVSDSEGFKAVIEGLKSVSESKGTSIPVIIGVSEGEREFIGLEEVISLARIARGNGLPVFINADHTYDTDKAKEAIDKGMDCVIIDKADRPYGENVEATKEIVQHAREKNPLALVEAELGFIGQSSKVLESLPEGVSPETQTSPEEAARFVNDTGIDLLAPSVGNVHGIVKSGEPKLNIERIKAIAEKVSIPLVLHGASGNSDEDILAAIEAGISIVHINTELRLAYKEGLKEAIDSNEVAPYKFMAAAVADMKEVVIKKLNLFNKI